MKETHSISTYPMSIDQISKERSHYSSSSHQPQSTIINLNKIIKEKEENDPNRTITESDAEQEEEEQIHPTFQTQPIIPPITVNETPGDHEHGRWTTQEHQLFLEGLMLFGNEWKNVQKHIRSRSATQARSHAQKFFIRLRKDLNKISDLQEIKERICKNFYDVLGNKFKPENREEFLNMMIKLIFTNENNIPSIHNNQQNQNGKNEMSEKLISVKGIKYREKEAMGKFNEIDERISQGSSYYSEQSQNHKQKIFTISKDSSRKASMNLQEPQKGSSMGQSQVKETKDNQNSKNNYQSTCINFVTINMVNNSHNNYINGECSNSNMHYSSNQNLNNSNNLNIQNKNNSKTTKSFKQKNLDPTNNNQQQKTNPFDLQFEQLLGNNNKASFNNGYMDDKFNNLSTNNDDIMSLLNFWG